ncbi:glycosyltransferase family 4 protein [Mucilaginibacter sp. X4EP1]|uniref:glycosyltransferase family 4 protein n=1 Tax=Mucilaginibacter sp. X4EP1 TaxID=2723092 RepID=UPI0021687150|nr:glycosyltransferase family 4 protein [Mucilaginibacter sp. X4EP1]MCS3815439.1 glycosyltransferase involved in cell wall biosynthesis [Mucilaginibacter sp. X4EP1]
MKNKLVVFDSHPVQYRVPIWQAIEQLQPGILHVVYASDCSVQGYNDKGFGRSFAWDEPMLTGYTNTILNCENGTPLSGWNSITGKGVKEIIETEKPSAILLTGLNYKYDLVAYLYAMLKGIPVWLRCETQDEAVIRTGFKAILRSVIYKIGYSSLNKVFYIGELNKQHFLKHSVKLFRLKPALYGTVDRFINFSDTEKQEIRDKARKTAEIDTDAFVIGFSGKFIPKKDPLILFEMLEHLPDVVRKKVHFYFMGSGELENELKNSAAVAFTKYGINTFFAGFVNQSQLASHYLAMDVMILPSRRMGETWGLVANEAMQAGCGVIVSDAVGCSANFKPLDRFRVFKERSAAELAKSVVELQQFTRNFEWANQQLTAYSIAATANAIINELP